MTRLLYIANARIPTEKAHGLQIMQMCEAFAAAGAEVTLWAARRGNTPEMRAAGDPFAYYGVRQNFTLRRVWSLDLQALGRLGALLRRATFVLQAATFVLAVCLRVWFVQAEVFYSRDLPTLYALSWVKPRARCAYEPHRLWRSRLGRHMQARVLRRAAGVYPITPTLRADLLPAAQQHAAKFLVAHDGVQAARFAGIPAQAAARVALGYPPEAFIVGYAGRLTTLGMGKGLDVLVEAVAALGAGSGVCLALVGGPDELVKPLREQWQARGLDPAAFFAAGQVAPPDVPLHLSAFDVCAMPHPHTAQFARHTSPLKLFEYMAARRAIVASDLPGWADVLAHEQTALLVPPGEAAALAVALRRLHADPALRARLADAAYARVMQHYTWAARARAILAHLAEAASC